MNSTDVRTTVAKFLYHWPLFMVSLVVSAMALALFLRSYRPTYEVSAALTILNDSKSQLKSEALQEIDFLNPSRIIENEIEVLRSKRLLASVVNELDLGNTYTRKNGFSNEELYNQSPVSLQVIRWADNVQSGVLDITIQDDSTFLLKAPVGSNQSFRFKDVLSNAFGKWKLTPTKYLSANKGQNIKISVTSPDAAALDYRQKLKIALSNKLSTTLTLSLDDAIPQRGKAILNKLIFNYNLNRHLERNKDTRTTLEFIDQRIANLSKDLNGIEKNIEVFKSDRGLTDISSKSKFSLENLQSNDNRLNAINLQLTVIEEIEKYLNKPENYDKIPTTLGIEDPGLRSMIEKLSLLQLQKERLLATTPETNPDFEILERQIVSTRSSVKNNIVGIKTTLQNQQSRLGDISRTFESEIRDIPTQERELLTIKRIQATKESLYTYLLEKREEIAVQYASSISEDKVVDYAFTNGPKRSIKSIAILLAILAGLGFPVALIYAREHLAQKINNQAQIKSGTTLPLICELHYQATKRPLAILENVLVREQFRDLRTKLANFTGEDKGGRVILVTSSISGEGKSFISSNLGLILSLNGRKTAILELDMFRPKLVSIFGVKQDHPGIAEYFKGEASIKDIAQNACNPYLDIICTGPSEDGNSAPLTHQQIENIIQHLRQIYDDIVIDSSPVHLISDGLIASRHADLTLYVLRQGHTHKAELDFINSLRQQGHIRDTYLILNGINRLKYGYGYSYDAGYYNDRKPGTFKNIFQDFSHRF